MKNFIQSLIVALLFIGNVFSQDLTITTTVCKPATSVRLTGPWWAWNPTGGPEAVDNKNGTWTFTFSPAPKDVMEYLIVVDGVQENLIEAMKNGGTCAPITDKATYANRRWLTTDSLAIANTYGKCGSCTVDELNITVEVCKPNATSVRLTGPWWNWDPNGGPVAKDQGNGKWKFTFSPAPKDTMEYLIVVDGVQENLIEAMKNGGTCAPITDKANYANRRWLTTDSLAIANTYGKCGACSVVVTGNQMDIPVTFDDSSVEYGLIGFGGAENSAIVPENGNSSNKVAKVLKSATAELWAGTTITTQAQLGFKTPIPFHKTTKLTVRVFSPDAGIPIRLKMEDHANNTHSVETEAIVKNANQWDTLTFDFAQPAQGTAALNTSFVYDKASIFFNFGKKGADAGEKTYYFDDVSLGDTIKPVQKDLTITVEVCKPNATSVRLTGPWWNWDPNGGPFAKDQGNGKWKFTFSPAPKDTMEYLIVVDGVQENLIEAMKNGGTCAPITDKANYANRRWLTTDSLAIANTYGKCGACSVVVTGNQMDIPVTFDDSSVEYGLIGFGGAENSAIVPENGNSSNKVAKVLKSATAELWAGTTITTQAQLGFKTPIPFHKTTKLTVRVFSPDAGIPIRLKMEDHANNTHSVETEAIVKNANQWDTLTFDFAQPAQGTAALNTSFVYDKASIFFNFGKKGADAGEKTYYFDDVSLGDTIKPVQKDLTITVEVCKPNATSVRLTGPWWNWDPNGGPVAKDQGNGKWKFTFSPAPTAALEYLIVVDTVQENLVTDMQNGGKCAPVTDYSNYANRKWEVGSGDVFIFYDRCVPCSYPDLTVTVQVCDSAKKVNLTGAIWSWNPLWGPQGINNGDGTWTIKLSPVPNDTLEYLIVKDGKTENLISNMQNGGGCAPVTDYSSYANRRWISGQGNIAITYNTCGVCLTNSIATLQNAKILIQPNPATSEIDIQSEYSIQSLNVFGIRGDRVLDIKSLNQKEFHLEISHWENGIYLLEVNTDVGSQIIRIVKE